MKSRPNGWIVLMAITFFPALVSVFPLIAQGSASDYEKNTANETVLPLLLEGMNFRSINFSRGGRSTAVAGVRGQSQVFYMGASGGGIWKTTDGGDPPTDQEG